jgi:hypothetical protein
MYVLKEQIDSVFVIYPKCVYVPAASGGQGEPERKYLKAFSWLWAKTEVGLHAELRSVY